VLAPVGSYAPDRQTADNYFGIDSKTGPNETIEAIATCRARPNSYCSAWLLHVFILDQDGVPIGSEVDST